MPIVDFPRGPMATPEAYPIDQPEDPDIGVVDISTNVVKIATKKPEKTEQVNCYECSECGSAIFYLYDDGEIECANPRCGGVISGIMVVEMGNNEA